MLERSRSTISTGLGNGLRVVSSNVRQTICSDCPRASDVRQPVSASADRIEVVDHPVDVGRDHGIADRLERHLRALLLREQLRFRQLAVGDVGHRTRHAHRPPRASRTERPRARNQR